MVAREIAGNCRWSKGSSRIERTASEINPKELGNEKGKPDSKRRNKGRTMLIAGQLSLHKGSKIIRIGGSYFLHGELVTRNKKSKLFILHGKTWTKTLCPTKKIVIINCAVKKTSIKSPWTIETPAVAPDVSLNPRATV